MISTSSGTGCATDHQRLPEHILQGQIERGEIQDPAIIGDLQIGADDLEGLGCIQSGQVGRFLFQPKGQTIIVPATGQS